MIQVTTENYTGADCTGSSGDQNRTLTLSNTIKTASTGLLVYASGLVLGDLTDFTIVHNDSGSVITFLNKLWDGMTIVVKYYQQKTTANVYEKMRNDFQGIITDHGKSYTIIRQTETVDSVGGVSAISEEEYDIFALVQDISRDDRQIHEMGLAVPGNSKAFFYDAYTDDETGNGALVVTIGDILKDEDSKRWRVEQIISKKQGDSNEIYRTGIIKKIDLDD